MPAWLLEDVDNEVQVCELHPTVGLETRRPDDMVLKEDQFHLGYGEDPFEYLWDDEDDIEICPACKLPGWLERRNKVFQQLHDLLSGKDPILVDSRDFSLFTEDAARYTDIEPDGYVWFDGEGVGFVAVCEALASGELRLWESKTCCGQTCQAEPLFQEEIETTDWYTIHQHRCWECDATYDAVRFIPDQAEMEALAAEANVLNLMVDVLIATNS